MMASALPKIVAAFETAHYIELSYKSLIIHE